MENMTNIALPKKITFVDGEQVNQKTVVIEPLFPGYGTTVGNSLRRVLLSSLPGTAVIGMKIKGADHEFMALPNIKEDILTIALNLKQLHAKVHSDEVIRLELEAHGEKEVKAADIKANSDIEIMNPDLVIAHITDMAGKLEMEIFITKGFGYETIENREEHAREIGYIEIDSIFSPVMSVGINVENTRVGKMTDWDKLSLNVITNGVITPEEAFADSVQILMDQFQTLGGKLKAMDEMVTEEAPAEKPTAEEATATKETKPTDDEDDLNKLTREELNTLATEKGIADPDKMKKKSDVIDAINNN
jgi:DNA-directed RNA polymerase subunit alpha